MTPQEFYKLCRELGATDPEAGALTAISWARASFNPNAEILSVGMGDGHDVRGAFLVYEGVHGYAGPTLQAQIIQALGMYREDMSMWSGLPIKFVASAALQRSNNLDEDEFWPVIIISNNPPIEHRYSSQLIELIERMTVTEWGWDRPAALAAVVDRSTDADFWNVFTIEGSPLSQGLISKYKKINRLIRAEPDLFSLAYSKGEVDDEGVAGAADSDSLFPTWAKWLALIVGTGGLAATVWVATRKKR